MTPEVEQKIRKRIEWQESKLKEHGLEYGYGSTSYARTEAYISALKWVLEIGAKVERS